MKYTLRCSNSSPPHHLRSKCRIFQKRVAWPFWRSHQHWANLDFRLIPYRPWHKVQSHRILTTWGWVGCRCHLYQTKFSQRMTCRFWFTRDQGQIHLSTLAEWGCTRNTCNFLDQAYYPASLYVWSKISFYHARQCSMNWLHTVCKGQVHCFSLWSVALACSTCKWKYFRLLKFSSIQMGNCVNYGDDDFLFL